MNACPLAYLWGTDSFCDGVYAARIQADSDTDSDSESGSESDSESESSEEEVVAKKSSKKGKDKDKEKEKGMSAEEKAKAQAAKALAKLPRLKPIDVKKMAGDQLKENLKARGQGTQGQKKELIQRLIDFEAARA